MSRATIILRKGADINLAHRWVDIAPPGTRLTFKAPKRSLAQNDKMWAMLTEVARQKEHAGRKYTADQWKVLFLHGCGREVQFIPSLDNSTFLPWGQSSSDLSVQEMTDLIEFMLVWGEENGINFQNQADVE